MKNWFLVVFLFLFHAGGLAEGAYGLTDSAKMPDGLYSLKWNPYQWSGDFKEEEFEVARRQYELQNYEKAFLRFRRLFVDAPPLTQIRAAYYMGIMHWKKQTSHPSNKEALYFLKYAGRRDKLVSPAHNFYSAAAQYELSRFFSKPAFVEHNFFGTHPLLLSHTSDKKGEQSLSSLAHAHQAHIHGFYWLQKSADNKHPLALFDLGERYFQKKRYLEALPLFSDFLKISRKPIWTFPSPLFKDMRTAHAHYRLAKMIQIFKTRGMSAIPLVRKHTASMSIEYHLEQAALKDHPLAQYELGELFFSSESFDKAFYWFYTLLTLNAKKGDHFVQARWIKNTDVRSQRAQGAFYLGLMYAFPVYYDLRGLELRSPTDQTKDIDHSPLVKPDPKRALSWFQYADRNQHRLAPGMIYQMQYQKSKFSPYLSGYLVTAAEKGHPLAQYQKALLSYKRDDIQGAYEWFSKLTQVPLTSPDYEVWRLAPLPVKEAKADAFYRLGQMVAHSKIPLDKALKGTTKTNFREWGAAVGIPGVLSSLAPASFYEMQTANAFSRLFADHKEDLKVLLTAFLYKKAQDLGHKEALVQLHYMKMTYRDRIHKKSSFQNSPLSWDLLASPLALSPPQEDVVLDSPQNRWTEKCRSLFSLNFIKNPLKRL